MTSTVNLSKAVWFITAAVFFMPSWVLADKLSNENSSKLRELSRLAKRSSVFGELDWIINDTPEFLNATMSFVGTILINGKTNSFAVGTLIYNEKNNTHQLLTVKHAFYDLLSSKKKQISRAYVGFLDTNRSYQLDISSLPDLLVSKVDIILVDFVDPIKRKGFSNEHIIHDWFEYRDDATMLSIVIKRPHVFKIVQENIRIQGYKDSHAVWYSDVDVISGMSGSPVFVSDNKIVKLLGIVTAKGLVKCAEFTVVCTNRVISLSNIY
jgi:hypothetical protein